MPFSSETQDQYGRDVSCAPDLDENFALVQGPAVVAQALWRRFSTPRGALAFHPNEGFDLRILINESFTPETLARMSAAIEAEALKDERVEEATASLEYLAASKKLVITITGIGAEGPFALTMFVSGVSVALIQEA